MTEEVRSYKDALHFSTYSLLLTSCFLFLVPCLLSTVYCILIPTYFLLLASCSCHPELGSGLVSGSVWSDAAS